MQANRISAVRGTMFGLLFGVMFAGSAPALAESTVTDHNAAALGRLTGAAKGCGVNPERVRKASDRLHTAIDASGGAPAERASVHSQFISAQTTGEREARNERSRCSAIHVEFSRLEMRLGRAPAEKVAAKRGVPPISALTQ